MKKTLTTALCSLLLISGMLVPQKAHALFGVGDIVLDPINLIQNTVSAVIGDKLSIKEYILDSAAYLLANTSLETMTQDIISWVNSGLDGNPLFVQNLSRYLANVEDVAAEDFFRELDGGFFQGPNTSVIRNALERAFHSARSDLADRFSPLYENVARAEAFLEGDFSQGGFDQFFEVFGVPQNNPYFAAIDLDAELERQTKGAQEEERQVLDWNDGFKSYRECQEGEENGKCSGDILTPGATTRAQLDEALALGGIRLANADEINEIVGAFLTQMVREAIGGAGGLLGVTGSSGGSGGSSLVDRTRNNDTTTPDSEELEGRIEQNLLEARQLIQILDASLALVQSGIAQIDGSTCSSGDLQSIRSNLLNRQSQLFGTQDATDSALRELQQLFGRLLLAEERDAYLEVARAYQQLLASGRIPDQTDIITAELAQTEIEDLNTQVNDIVNNCSGGSV